MAIERFSVRELPVTRWKNGAGTTQELAIWPQGSGLDRFSWRVSIASVAATGSFSVFAGIDRSIMLLGGEGLLLRSADGSVDHRLDRRFSPFAFQGDLALEGSLLGGPSRDLNMMSRRGAGRGEMRVFTQATSLPPEPFGVLLGLSGRWRIGDLYLDEAEGLRWLDEPLAHRLVPEQEGAAIVAATWRPD